MATNTHDITGTSDGPERLAVAAGGIAAQATSVAEQRASSTMTQLGESLEQVARAVRDAGNEIRAEQPQIASLGDTVAQQAERAGQYLRAHDAGEVVEGVQDFARRQPVIVIGAGLALGLLVGRALKSATGTSRTGHGDRSGGSQWSGGNHGGGPAGYDARGSRTVGGYGGAGYGGSAAYGASTTNDVVDAAAADRGTGTLLHEGDHSTDDDLAERRDTDTSAGSEG